MARNRQDRNHDTHATTRPQNEGMGAAQPGPTDIAARAYELYEQRGREHGHDWDDWFTAERELREPGHDTQVS